ncbi:MAG: hypothetical protein KAI73_03620 [Rhodospirillaceae bacterium]|nr:hypothetical protein [Rhodospirillaceae bacterium]
MAIKTQGTYLYTIDPDTEALIQVACVTSLEGIDNTNESIDVTCLEDLAKQFTSGQSSPGQASFGLNFDADEASHTRLHQLKVEGTTLPWAVGFSDGVAPAAVDSGGTFDLATSRSWIRFLGFMVNFPFSFPQNSVIQSTVGIQISGEPEIFAKTT